MPLSDVKTFALEVLDVFDELARPEIKRTVFKKMWEYLKNYSYKMILKKSDDEINTKLLMIHKKLNKRFKNIDSSIEINIMEKLNPSVSIPPVGELAEIKNLTTITSHDQAQRLYKELF